MMAWWSVVLVDFGNTLADQTFMWRDDPAFGDWVTHYGSVVRRLAHDWECGTTSTSDLATAIAASAMAVLVVDRRTPHHEGVGAEDCVDHRVLGTLGEAAELAGANLRSLASDVEG